MVIQGFSTIIIHTLFNFLLSVLLTNESNYLNFSFVTTMRKKTLEKGSIKVHTSAGLKFLLILQSLMLSLFPPALGGISPLIVCHVTTLGRNRVN